MCTAQIIIQLIYANLYNGNSVVNIKIVIFFQNLLNCHLGDHIQTQTQTESEVF